MNEITRNIREYFDLGGDIVGAMVKFRLTRPSTKHYFIEWKQEMGLDSSTSHGEQKINQVELALNGRTI